MRFSRALPGIILLVSLLYGNPSTGKSQSLTEVRLSSIELEDFSSVPDAQKSLPSPAFVEKPFNLKNAVNYREVLQAVGGLTDAQEAFLEKNRFVLLPKKWKKAFGNFETINEMLSDFDSIGNPSTNIPYQAQARFLNADPFLHALHMYYSNRLKYLEESYLSHCALTLVQGLYTNAAKMRSEAGANAPSWERLQAQMLIPLILLRNCAFPGGSFTDKDINDPDLVAEWQNFENKALAKQGRPDNITSALNIFEEYKSDFSPETASQIEAELKQIYAADKEGRSYLGFTAAHSSDYTQFAPRGHYSVNSVTRAYFRAMIWLGQLGWNLETAEGCAQALNFAIAMSMPDAVTPGGTAAENTEDEEPQETSYEDNGYPVIARTKIGKLAAFKSIMEISSFFVGYLDEPCYPEWQAYVVSTLGESANAQSSGDPKIIAKLSKNLDKLNSNSKQFASMHQPFSGVMKVLPQRFTVPYIIAERLTYKDNDLPLMFSALWVPAVFGNKYAESLVEKQLELCFTMEANASLDGSPVEKKVPQGKKKYKREAKAMRKAILDLRAELTKEAKTSWDSSLGAAWLSLLSRLNQVYGEGYPLYMRGPFFQVKQLETFLGSFTELKHDTVLYEKPNYSEMGEGGEPDEPTFPKGFVEPDILFWRDLLDFTGTMEAGFAKYGLFETEYKEEYGALNKFRTTVRFCADIAEKELRGEALSREEYDRIRESTYLEFMATPVRRSSSVKTEGNNWLSGLIIDIQTSRSRPNSGWEKIVYEATADPYIMLVLVGNEDSPRLVVGTAYNHREFITPFGERLNDKLWRDRIYNQDFPASQEAYYYIGAHYSNAQAEETILAPEQIKKEMEQKLRDLRPALPPKNFWYDGLHP